MLLKYVHFDHLTYCCMHNWQQSLNTTMAQSSLLTCGFVLWQGFTSAEVSQAVTKVLLL